MRIWLDPQKLKQRGLTTEDVVNAIREQNVQVAAGQIGAARPGRHRVSADGQHAGPIVDEEQFENIIVATGETGGLPRQGHRQVELGGKDYTYDSRFNGNHRLRSRSTSLPDANAMETAAWFATK